MLALAVILPLVTGYFDFSLGGIAASSSVLTNGLLVARLGLNSFVTTLGMATLLGGLIEWYTRGQTILAGIDLALPRFDGSTWLGLPRVFVVALAALML